MPESISLARIDQLEIKLTVAAEVYLQIVMMRNGMVNRRGDGNHAGGPLVMGRPEEPIFEAYLQAIPPELLAEAGRYELPDQQGDPSELIISFKGEGIDTGFAFRYGSASMGPPEEFVELVDLALELTEEWYQTKRPGQK
jgi:hypothetical protein